MARNGMRARAAKRSPWSAMGWADFMAGMPYLPCYDELEELDQRNYENGRLRAAQWLAWGKARRKQQVAPRTFALEAIAREGLERPRQCIPPRR